MTEPMESVERRLNVRDEDGSQGFLGLEGCWISRHYESSPGLEVIAQHTGILLRLSVE
jgi:hypothetical protein